MGRHFHEADAALDAAVLAMQSAGLTPGAPGRIAFIHARPHEALRDFGDRLDCLQDYKPVADALAAAGIPDKGKLDGPYDMVLLLPKRQRERTLADFAYAFSLLREGGILLVALHNDWGARRFEDILADVSGEVGSLSKFHCRAFWTRKSSAFDTTALNEWKAAGEPQPILDGRFWSQPGLFSWNEIDTASDLLCRTLPQDICGIVADLGSGWGYLSHQLLENRLGIRELSLVEADRAALQLSQRNLSSLAGRAKVSFFWADVAAGTTTDRYDWIVTNPPFHDDRQSNPQLGAAFLSAAARALKPGGELWAVANRNLPYERVLRELFASHELVVQEGGFKVLRGVKGAGRDLV